MNGRQLLEDVGLEIDDDVPALRRGGCATSRNLSFGASSTRRLRKLKRTPRMPPSCSAASSSSEIGRIDHRDAARLAVRLRDGVQRRAIVGAVAARLHDDVACKAEPVAQREQHLGSGILRQIFRLGAERELRHRAEDMAMRVDRARAAGRSAGLEGCRSSCGCARRHPNTTPSISLRAVRSMRGLGRLTGLVDRRARSRSRRSDARRDSVLRPPSGIDRDRGGGRAVDQAGGGDADRAEHADRGMGAVRDEAADGDRAAVAAAGRPASSWAPIFP